MYILRMTETTFIQLYGSYMIWLVDRQADGQTYILYTVLYDCKGVITPIPKTT